MKIKEVCEIAGNGTMYILTALTTEQVMNYINLGLSILISIIIITAKIYGWIKKSTEDGKIDKDEIKEGLDIIQEGVEDIKKLKGEDKDDSRKNEN